MKAQTLYLKISKGTFLFYSRKSRGRDNTISLPVHANTEPTLESNRDAFLYGIILFSPIFHPQTPSPALTQPWVTSVIRQKNLKLSKSSPRLVGVDGSDRRA